MSEPFLAEIKMFGGNFAPRGYAFCNGQQMSIAQNSALFSLLGTTYGGNGQTTYGLPDFRGRAPIHWGTGNGLSPVDIGEIGGSETTTLTIAQMPMHNHTAVVSGTINVLDGVGDSRSATGNVLAGDNSGDQMYSNQPPTGTLAPSSLSATATIGVSGGSQPLPIESPYLAVTFIIALQGTFPSRN